MFTLFGYRRPLVFTCTFLQWLRYIVY